MPVGLSPTSANEVNTQIGTHLRQFINIKETIGHDHEWLTTADLKADPYNMIVEEETLIKSAIADLDSNLDAINMTFINRLVGLF